MKIITTISTFQILSKAQINTDKPNQDYFNISAFYEKAQLQIDSKIYLNKYPQEDNKNGKRDTTKF